MWVDSQVIVPCVILDNSETNAQLSISVELAMFI